MSQSKFQFSRNAACDPIEAWAQRLISSGLTTTAKCVGLILAHRFAASCPNPMRVDEDAYRKLMRSAGLSVGTNKDHRQRAWRAIEELNREGLIVASYDRTERQGRPIACLVAIEVISSREVK